MSKQTRIIKITDNKLYYTPQDFINVSDTNFLSFASFNVRFEIFWLIEILNYKKAENILVVSVIDYSLEEKKPFFEQKAKSKVSGFEFCKLKWQMLEPVLSFYQKNKLVDIVDNIYEPEKDDNEIDTPLTENDIFKQHTLIDDDNLQEIKPKIEQVKKYTKHFTYYFKDAIFKLGYVEIYKFFDFVVDKVDFKIYNDNIIPEYNFIKNYFPKVFENKKQFNVKAIIEIKGNYVIKARAYSKEISSINDELISSVKKLRTLELMKLVQTEDVDKNLFTADEIWDEATDEGQDGNIFNQNEEDIVNILMNLPDVRNKKQLEYLAGSKHNAKEKIRFTLRPLFGFIFYIEGEIMNHYCWELLNSHATYIWSFEKDERTDVQLKRIEEIVNIIRDTGRKKYKSAYLRNEMDADIFFNTINHKHAKSDFKDSFVMWKHKFKELLV